MVNQLVVAQLHKELTKNKLGHNTYFYSGKLIRRMTLHLNLNVG